MITRRQFIKLSMLSGSSLLFVPSLAPVGSLVRAATPATNGSGASKFVQNLRGVGPAGIPVAVKDGLRVYKGTIAQHYTIDLVQFTDQIHPDLGPTTLWGYNPRNALGVTGTVTPRHLGGIIIAEKNVPVQITFQNKLPNKHILPVDTTLMGAEGAQNRATVHLHGGQVPWISDGGPFTWFDPDGNYGPSAQSGSLNIYKLLNKNLKPGQAEYYYPNNQSARFVWYHDHALGTTRLNAYAGLASAYIIRDLFERALVKFFGLPDFIENGGREIPLIIQEKLFVGSNIAAQDANWNGPSSPGSLWYPHVYDPNRWDLASSASGAKPLPSGPSCIPEMFGDTMLVNGTVYPKVRVEPRRYRLRLLNATQARFLNLQLYVESTPGSGLPDLTKGGPDFLVIGTEGGFLAKPVLVKSGIPLSVETTDEGNRMVMLDNPGGSLLTAPAERWDIIIDFKNYAGKSLVLYNDSPAPFPMGSADNDNPVDANGILINQTIMRFDVDPSITGKADPPLYITPNFPLAADPLSGIDRPLTGKWTTAPQSPPAGVKVRQLTLNEVFDEYGRLIQMLGTNELQPKPDGFILPADATDQANTFARQYMDPATETAQKDAVEVWQIANLTGDTHPMHFHLVNVQVLSRQRFDVDKYDGTPTYTGPLSGPALTELGWKDTVKMNPGEVTTVMMKFSLPAAPFDVPASPRTGGNEYVWHCHILEHEEHDMMRPLIVTGSNPKV